MDTATLLRTLYLIEADAVGTGGRAHAVSVYLRPPPRGLDGGSPAGRRDQFPFAQALVTDFREPALVVWFMPIPDDPERQAGPGDWDAAALEAVRQARGA